MIKRILDIDSYWKVIVYYNVDYNFFDIVYADLKSIGASNKTINRIYNNLKNHAIKGVTVSNTKRKVSVVLFCEHRSKADYINTVVHEAEHIKQSMLDAYNVEDRGEPPAYTIGYLVMKMLMFKVMKAKSR